MKSNFFKKIKFHLQLWDGIWSILLSGILFLVTGMGLQLLFANPDDPQGSPGFYDPSFLQAAIYASFIQVTIHTAIMLGIYMGFRGVWRYFYGFKKPDRTIENKSKDDFNSLHPLQRILVAFSLYLMLSAEWLLIFNLLV